MSASLVVLLTGGTLPAHAQICAGRASFNLAPTQFVLDAGVNGDGQGVGASVGHGRDAWFAFASAATHAITGLERVQVVGATLATDQPLSPDNKLHVCPMITVGYVSGTSGAAGRDGRIGASASGDAAMLAINTPGLRVMPTIGIDLRLNGVGRTTGLFAQDSSRSDSTFSAGIGFVFANRLSVVPRVVVPFRSASRSGMQMTASYNLLR